jgi:CubicO group peptidase (beta-lactamase class C family)
MPVSQGLAPRAARALHARTLPLTLAGVVRLGCAIAVPLGCATLGPLGCANDRSATRRPAPPPAPRDASGRPSPGVLGGEVGALVRPLVDQEWVSGLAVGLLARGERATYGFGRRSAADAKPPTEDTIFEIGSATKVFTALLLADAVVRGDVKLADPASASLPPGGALPPPKGRPIQLLHLATHTSGLPRMPNNLSPRDPRDPYADYNDEALYYFLQHLTLTRAPEERYEYSNLGAGLLGQLLASRAHQSYEALVTSALLQPLQLADTRVALDDAARARLAEGHDADGDVVPGWNFAALAGAGALRSTTRDLLRFLELQIEPDKAGPLARAIRLTHAGRFPTTQPPGAVALGWHVRPGGRIYWHNGQTGGYHSFLAFDPEARVGVVLLASTGTSRFLDSLGLELLDLLSGGHPPPLALSASPTVERRRLERYVGRYAITPQFEIAVTLKDGRLYGQATGQPKFRLFPESDTRFALRVVEASLTFEAGDKGKAEALILHQHGADQRARRVGD